MLLELVTVFVAAFIVIVAVGHVLLFATILRCLREDFVELLPARSKCPEARRGFVVEPGHVSVARNKPLLNFAEQRRALGRDLRYVVTVTGSQC